MEMLQLRYFYESAKNESFAKTAKKYMVPTTSVSASVRRLESELGMQLFDRKSNQIMLNESGRQFFQSISNIFSELDRAVSSLHDTPEENCKINILTWGFRTTLTNSIIEYNKTHPNVSFNLDVDFDEDNFENYDIIVIQKQTDRLLDYENFEFRTYRIKIEAAEDNPLCERSLTLKQLENYPFVTTGTNNDIYKVLIRACKREGFTPKFVFECNDYICIDRALRVGLGLGVTLSSGAGAASVGMRHLNVTDFDEKLSMYVYYKKQNYHGGIKSFIDYLKTLAV